MLLQFFFSVLSIVLITLIPSAIYIALLHERLTDEQPSSIKVPFVSLAVGSLLGNVFYHLLPEALNLENSSPSTLLSLTAILAGILIFLFGEQVLQQYHHGHGHSHFEENSDIDIAHQDRHEHRLPAHFSHLLISSDIIHGFLDGAAIGASFLSSNVVGISTSIAVFFHEVPHVLGDMIVMASMGIPRPRLIVYVGLMTLASLTGAGFVNFLQGIVPARIHETVQGLLLSLATGNFLYIALADLIPEVLIRKYPTQNRGYMHYVYIIAGCALMLFLKIAVHSHDN